MILLSLECVQAHTPARVYVCVVCVWCVCVCVFSVAPPAEPRGEKKHFFVQILGGEKLLKFVEKCRWNIFKRPETG